MVEKHSSNMLEGMKKHVGRNANATNSALHACKLFREIGISRSEDDISLSAVPD